MTINQKVQDRIDGFPTGHVFMASDFNDLADVNTIWQYLARLEHQGRVSRITRGTYYKPAFSKLIGEYEAPSIPETARALAHNYHWTIAPSGNTALNLLGLSTQVPAKWTYISDGPYRSYTIGNQVLEFRHRSNREISGLSEKSAMVVQAIRAIGQGRLSEQNINKIRGILTDAERIALLKETKNVAGWIYRYIKTICSEDIDSV